jgi:hypothetical protein
VSRVDATQEPSERSSPAASLVDESIVVINRYLRFASRLVPPTTRTIVIPLPRSGGARRQQGSATSGLGASIGA